MPHFDIYKPNGSKFRLFFTSEDDRTEVVDRLLLTYWREYCDEHWLWQKKYDPFKMNFEDKTKSFLERCATFLLLGSMGESNIISDYGKIRRAETALIEDNDEVTTQYVDFDPLPTGEEALPHTIPHKRTRKKIEKRYRDSQCYKIGRIHGFAGSDKCEYVALRNKDVAEARMPEGENVVKWKLKTFKNVHGDPVYVYRKHVIKPRPGVIDTNRPYKSTWCYVWADNVFDYGGAKWRIADCVAGYQETDGAFAMDKVLVYEQDGKMYFFDQSINEINNENVWRLQG